jgi:hypothetical protein
MLKALRGKVSDRKLRLFAVACCRPIYSLITDDRSRTAVETAECYADRQATADQLLAAKTAARRAAQAGGWYEALAAALAATREDAFQAARNAALYAARAGAWNELGCTTAAAARKASAQGYLAFGMPWREARIVQANLLREVFGNAFHPPVLSRTVLTWHDGLVVHLAQAADQERHLPAGTLDKGRLAILADALEEAGCDNRDILDHLRGPRPHVRGCWPVDLCLGKS